MSSHTPGRRSRIEPFRGETASNNLGEILDDEVVDLAMNSETPVDQAFSRGEKWN